MPRHIVIIGDSFASGEWIDHVVTHGGVAQYLHEDGFHVSNLSQPGGAMSWLLLPLRNFLTANRFSGIRKIILFQTDISRNFSDITQQELCKRLIHDNPALGVEDILDLLYLECYKQFEELASEFDVEILVVGGLTDITADLSELPHLKTVVSSMSMLFDPELEPRPLRLMSNQWMILDEIFGNKKDLLDLMEQQSRRNEYMKNNQWYKDGFHAGREIHRACYEKLLPHL